jgi:hypothetical protein
VTFPLRDAFRPTTTLAGPMSVTSLRQAILLALCLVLWYFAASYALGLLLP